VLCCTSLTDSCTWPEGKRSPQQPKCASQSWEQARLQPRAGFYSPGWCGSGKRWELCRQKNSPLPAVRGEAWGGGWLWWPGVPEGMRCRAAPCHKGAEMRHPHGACELTWPGLGVLESEPANVSWAELAFGITRPLPLRGCFLLTTDRLLRTSQLPSSFRGNYDFTFGTDLSGGRYGVKV